MKTDFVIPVVDLSDSGRESGAQRVAERLGEACREHGFFYISGHGVSPTLLKRLECLSRTFFALQQSTKMRIDMERAGRAWRGYFPVGAELTSGEIDQKEGIYFGRELPPDDERVRRGLPLHGANQFPELAGFREAVIEYMDCLTRLGQHLMGLLALSLELPRDYFVQRFTADPFVLFRIFHYPALQSGSDRWSVGEHTDYGLLTILFQDNQGGLEVFTGGRWVEARPIPGTFVCNIGDMLDRMTSGQYRSTPHRVRNRGRLGRLSFPFFFDPDFDAEIRAIDPAAEIPPETRRRWDQTDIHEVSGVYGNYLTAKVARVFPRLWQAAE